MTVKDKADKIFGAYEEYMEDISDRLMQEEAQSADVYSEAFQDNFLARLSEMTHVFFASRLADIAYDSPNAFFEALSDIDTCMQVFSVASRYIEEEMPEALIERIFSFEEAESRLLHLALESDWHISAENDVMEAREDLMASMNALSLLGQKKIIASIMPVIQHFYSAELVDDYVADVFSKYAINMGELIIPELIARLNIAQNICAQSPDENTMMILAKVGASHRSEDIYNCLRRAFKKSDRKIYALLSFRDYGDPQIITMIKGYLDRNGRMVGREFFYEALSVVQKLGGDIDDVTDPFKDFSGK